MTIITDKSNLMIKAFGKLSDCNAHKIVDVLAIKDRVK